MSTTETVTDGGVTSETTATRFVDGTTSNADLVTTTTEATTADVTTAEATSTEVVTTHDATPVTSSQRPPDDGISDGAIAGIVIGCVLGLLLLICLLYFCYKRCKNRRNKAKGMKPYTRRKEQTRRTVWVRVSDMLSRFRSNSSPEAPPPHMGASDSQQQLTDLDDARQGMGYTGDYDDGGGGITNADTSRDTDNATETSFGEVVVTVQPERHSDDRHVEGTLALEHTYVNKNDIEQMMMGHQAAAPSTFTPHSGEAVIGEAGTEEEKTQADAAGIYENLSPEGHPLARRLDDQTYMNTPEEPANEGHYPTIELDPSDNSQRQQSSGHHGNDTDLSVNDTEAEYPDVVNETEAGDPDPSNEAVGPKKSEPSLAPSGGYYANVDDTSSRKRKTIDPVYFNDPVYSRDPVYYND